MQPVFTVFLVIFVTRNRYQEPVCALFGLTDAQQSLSTVLQLTDQNVRGTLLQLSLLIVLYQITSMANGKYGKTDDLRVVLPQSELVFDQSSAVAIDFSSPVFDQTLTLNSVQMVQSLHKPLTELLNCVYVMSFLKLIYKAVTSLPLNQSKSFVCVASFHSFSKLN